MKQILLPIEGTEASMTIELDSFQDQLLAMARFMNERAPLRIQTVEEMLIFINEVTEEMGE